MPNGARPVPSDKQPDDTRAESSARASTSDEEWRPSETVSGDTNSNESAGRANPSVHIFQIGDVLAERWKIRRFVAKGGMGEVYEAEDLELATVVALKTLDAEFAASEEMLARFRRETLLARKVNHPNVCRIYDIGRHRHPAVGETLFLTMEYLHGETLRIHLQRSGPMSCSEALPLVEQMSSALQAAHDLGIVHRDFKPSNVILVSSGSRLCAKITDFGLARNLGMLVNEITVEGLVIGTPAYMAPEQFRGVSSPASDIYSLGIVMREMIVPKKALTAPQNGEALAEREKKAIAELDPYWRAAIEKCLHEEPTKRFARADEVPAALVCPSGVRGLSKTKRYSMVLSAVAVAILLVAAWIFRDSIVRLFNPGAQSHIAVLGFESKAAGETNRAFCDGLTESLTGKLSQLQRYQNSLWVVPYVDAQNVTLKDAYKNLHATVVVTGSVERKPDSIHVIANLIDAKSHRQLDSIEMEVPVNDIATLQDTVWQGVARMIDERIDSHITPETKNVMAAGNTRQPGAYELYEQGLGYLQRHAYDSDLIAVGLLGRAIDKDPNYALAYAARSEAFMDLYQITQDVKWGESAQRSASRAAQIEPNLAQVNVALGHVEKVLGGPNDAKAKARLADAEVKLKLAIDEDRNAVDAYDYLGGVYEKTGRIDEARKMLTEVVAEHPTYWPARTNLGHFYYKRGEQASAIEQYKKAIELQADNPVARESLGGIYVAMDRNEDAIATLKPGRDLPASPIALSNLSAAFMNLRRYPDAISVLEKATAAPDASEYSYRNLAECYLATHSPTKTKVSYKKALDMAKLRLKVNSRDADALSSVALYDAHLGRGAEAQSYISRALDVAPKDGEVHFTAALVYETLGDRERALKNAELGIEDGYSQALLEKEPELDALRRDSRYQSWAREHRQSTRPLSS